jgi:hypothetical protein
MARAKHGGDQNVMLKLMEDRDKPADLLLPLADAYVQ